MLIRTTNVSNGVRVEYSPGGGRWNNLGIFPTLTAALDGLSRFNVPLYFA